MSGSTDRRDIGEDVSDAGCSTGGTEDGGGVGSTGERVPAEADGSVRGDRELAAEPLSFRLLVERTPRLGGRRTCMLDPADQSASSWPISLQSLLLFPPASKTSLTLLRLP